MSRVKVGLASFAHMHMYSYAHCLSTREDAAITVIWDEDHARGNEMAERFGCEFEPDLEQFFDKDTEAVIVCTENSNHSKVAIPSAQAGKHILCEKPLSSTIEDGLAMIKAADDNNIKLATAFPCRFSPAMDRMRQVLREGCLGDIIGIAGTNRGSFPGGWFTQKALSGGGAVADHTVHVADLLRWMLNSEVKSIYCEYGELIRYAGIDDCGIVSLEFENGVVATIDCSWSRPRSYPIWGDVTMKVTGTSGCASLDMFNQKFTLHSDETMRTTFQAWGENIDAFLIDDFLTLCKGGQSERLATGLDGLRACEIFIAAYKSAESRQPVSLERAVTMK